MEERLGNLCGSLFLSGSNAEEYSRIENVQNTSVDNKKGYRIVTVTRKCFLFH